MSLPKCVLSTLVALLVLPAALCAAGFEKIESEVTQKVSAHLLELFQKEAKDVQVKFEGNPEKAVGLHGDRKGIIIVPIKSLKEGEIDPAVESETGAGICYLFMSPEYNPLVDGKPVDAKKVRTLKFTDGEGNEREATALLVTARHLEGDDWRLYVYGTEKKPLIETRWGVANDNAEGDLAIHVNGAKDKKANLVFTLFNKYAAMIEIAHE